MLKIEPAKNFAAPKRELTKTSGGNAESQSFDSASEAGDGGGEFARVLENLTSKKDSPNKELDVAKPKEHEKDSHSKLDRHQKDNQPTKAKSDNRLTAGEEAAGATATGQRTNTENFSLETEMSVPPARAIMHIADLERIVSSVRTQAFDGNSQIVITLKNSVCSGLQIKLTTDDNHRVTAEFIAANEKVKAQIDARSGELADLLKQRGIKLTSLQTTVGSDTSGGNKDQRQSEDFENLGVSAKTFKSLADQGEVISEVNETINTYRV